MNIRKRYRRRPETAVAAVQLDLDTEGFDYLKWGHTQRCKPGDWIVNNGDECYTVDADVFRSTYREISTGVYLKTTPVWAVLATEPGSVPTKEGITNYEGGDFIVSNNADGADAYAVKPDEFKRLYEADD